MVMAAPAGTRSRHRPDAGGMRSASLPAARRAGSSGSAQGGDDVGRSAASAVRSCSPRPLRRAWNWLWFPSGPHLQNVIESDLWRIFLGSRLLLIMIAVEAITVLVNLTVGNVYLRTHQFFWRVMVLLVGFVGFRTRHFRHTVRLLFAMTFAIQTEHIVRLSAGHAWVSVVTSHIMQVVITSIGATMFLANREALVWVAVVPLGWTLLVAWLGGIDPAVTREMLVCSIACQVFLGSVMYLLDQKRRKIAQQYAEVSRARDEAQALVQAKTQFIAAMSHELRTPLTGLVDALEVLAESNALAASLTGRATVRIAQECAQALVALSTRALQYVEYADRRHEALARATAAAAAAAAASSGAATPPGSSPAMFSYLAAAAGAPIARPPPGAPDEPHPDPEGPQRTDDRSDHESGAVAAGAPSDWRRGARVAGPAQATRAADGRGAGRDAAAAAAVGEAGTDGAADARLSGSLALGTPKPVPLRTVLAEAVRGVRALPAARAVRVQCSVSAAADAVAVVGDEYLRDLLQNLLRFAVAREPPSPGLVRVHVHLSPVGGGGGGAAAPPVAPASGEHVSALAVRVSDHGPPLSAEQLSQGIQPLMPLAATRQHSALASGASFDLGIAQIIAGWLHGAVHFERGGEAQWGACVRADVLLSTVLLSAPHSPGEPADGAGAVDFVLDGDGPRPPMLSAVAAAAVAAAAATAAASPAAGLDRSAAMTRPPHGADSSPAPHTTGSSGTQDSAVGADASATAVEPSLPTGALLLPRTTLSPPTELVRPPAAAGRALVVDDSPINVAVMVRLLQRLGFECDTASDGAEAVAKWRAATQPYRVILMDLLMPGVDGLTATETIRAAEWQRVHEVAHAEQGDGGTGSAGRSEPGPPASAPPRARTPIVAVTASVAADVEQRCLTAGMDGFVGKPIRQASVAAALRWVGVLPLEPEA